MISLPHSYKLILYPSVIDRMFGIIDQKIYYIHFKSKSHSANS